MSELSKKKSDRKGAGKAGTGNADAFEIGLVLGGAVSAGTYTAGVLDFLFEALEAWGAAKKQEAGLPLSQRKIPPHNVKINAVAGGSAGGMIAAISAAELRGAPHRLIDNGGDWPESTSRFYRAWVNEVTLEKLLGDSDLKQGQRVKSILNSDILQQVAATILLPDNNSQPSQREYISDKLNIILTLANLRGVPYGIEFEGNEVSSYGMRLHRDHIIFQLDRNGDLHCDDPGFSPDQVWQTLKDCGIAAGIFPIALAPQMISRKAQAYRNRKWFIPLKEEMENGALLCTSKASPIAPTWPPKIQSDPDFIYRFLSIDGGVFNNEPFDLARRAMAPGSMLVENDSHRIRQAIFLIDPFPEMTTYDVEYTAQGYLTETIPQFLRALINQGRFKMEDVYLAKNEKIYSRYMLVPKRSGEFSKEPLACGCMGGFSGFFNKEFRIHDYFLGRRNCQRFLSQHFVLPYEKKSGKENNPIFKDWTDAMIDAYRVKDSPGITRLPVIPLVGEAQTTVPKYPYPNLRVENSLDVYRAPIKKRIKTVLKSLMKTEFMKSKIAYTLAGMPLAWGLSLWLTSKILKTVKADFKKGKLIRE